MRPRKKKIDLNLDAMRNAVMGELSEQLIQTMRPFIARLDDIDTLARVLNAGPARPVAAASPVIDGADDETDGDVPPRRRRRKARVHFNDDDCRAILVRRLETHPDGLTSNELAKFLRSSGAVPAAAADASIIALVRRIIADVPGLITKRQPMHGPGTGSRLYRLGTRRKPNAKAATPQRRRRAIPQGGMTKKQRLRQHLIRTLTDADAPLTTIELGDATKAAGIPGSGKYTVINEMNRELRELAADGVLKKSVSGSTIRYSVNRPAITVTKQEV